MEDPGRLGIASVLSEVVVAGGAEAKGPGRLGTAKVLTEAAGGAEAKVPRRLGAAGGIAGVAKYPEMELAGGPG